jgi:hypothetical protein
MSKIQEIDTGLYHYNYPNINIGGDVHIPVYAVLLGIQAKFKNLSLPPVSNLRTHTHIIHF